MDKGHIFLLKNLYVCIGITSIFQNGYASFPNSTKAFLKSTQYYVPTQQHATPRTMLQAQFAPSADPYKELIKLLRTIPTQRKNTLETYFVAPNFNFMLTQLNHLQQLIEEVSPTLSARNRTILQTRMSFMSSYLLYLEKYGLPTEKQNYLFLKTILTRIEKSIKPPQPMLPVPNDLADFSNPFSPVSPLATEPSTPTKNYIAPQPVVPSTHAFGLFTPLTPDATRYM